MQLNDHGSRRSLQRHKVVRGTVGIDGIEAVELVLLLFGVAHGGRVLRVVGEGVVRIDVVGVALALPLVVVGEGVVVIVAVREFSADGTYLAARLRGEPSGHGPCRAGSGVVIGDRDGDRFVAVVTEP